MEAKLKLDKQLQDFYAAFWRAERWRTRARWWTRWSDECLRVRHRRRRALRRRAERHVAKRRISERRLNQWWAKWLAERRLAERLMVEWLAECQLYWVSDASPSAQSSCSGNTGTWIIGSK